MTAEDFLAAPDAETLAHTFATPDDLANYARTGSLATGDNGVGHPDLGGLDTTRVDVPMVALPEQVLVDRFGSVAAARGQYVDVQHTGNGQTVRALIGDVGPGHGSVRKGVGLDLNPGAAAAIGATGEDPVTYTFAGARQSLGSARDFLNAPDDDALQVVNSVPAGVRNVTPPASLGSAAAFLAAPGNNPPANPFAVPPPPADPDATTRAAQDTLADTFTPQGKAYLDKLVQVPDVPTPPQQPGFVDGLLHGSGNSTVNGAIAAGAQAGNNLIAGAARFVEGQNAQYLEGQPHPQVDPSPEGLERRRLEITARLADIDEENAHGDGPPLPPSAEEQRLRAELATLTPQGQAAATVTARSAADARDTADHLTGQDVGHQIANIVPEVRGGAAAGTLGIAEGVARTRAGTNPATPGNVASYLNQQIAQGETDLQRVAGMLQDHPASLELSSEQARISGQLASLRNQRQDLSRVQPGGAPGMGSADLLTPEGQAARDAAVAEDNASADTLRDAKADTGTMFGQDPALKDTKLARAARAGGEVVPLVGAGMVPGVGTAAAAGAAGLQAKASAFDEYYGEAINRGVPDEQAKQEAQDYSDAAALRSIPEMAAFLGTGKVAAGVVSKLLSPSAPAVVRALVTGAASTAANATAGTANQLLEQAVGGKPLDASYSLERGVQDALFGGMHTAGEMGNRAAEVQQAMKDDAAAQKATSPDQGRGAAGKPVTATDQMRRDEASVSSPAKSSTTSGADETPTAPVFAEGDTPEQRAQAFLQPQGDQPPTAASFSPDEAVPATLGRFPRVEQPDGGTVVYDPAEHDPEDFQADDSAGPAPDLTSIKNSVTSAERAARGFAPAEQAAQRDFGTVWDDAKATLADDPTAGQRLIAEINAKPRAATDTENALLLHEQIGAQAEHDAAVQAVNDAPDDGARAAAQVRLANAHDNLFKLYQATKASGSETGRGLNTRKMLAAQDYTLPAMLNRRRAANDGQPLTRQQQAEVENAYAKVADAKAKVDAHGALIAEVDAHLAGDPDWTPPEDEAGDQEAEHRADVVREARNGISSAGGVELLDAVRAAGGLPTDDAAFRGELQTIREAHAPLAQAGKTGTFNLFRRSAPKLDELTSRLREQGFDVETPDDTLDLIYQRLTSKRPEYGFAARAEAQSGMASSEAYFRRQPATPPRTPEELRPVQERWNRALRMVAPKTALQLEIIKQDALDSMWQGQKRPSAADGSSPHAAYLNGAVYLSDKALRENPDHVNRVNFLHEIVHHFERALPVSDRMQLEAQRERELQSGKSPLHNADGTPRADVDPRAFDTGNRSNFSEWLAERVAWDNEAHFGKDIDTAVNGTATARLAAHIRRFVSGVWKSLRPGMPADDINAKFREWLGRGASVDSEPVESGPQFARRDRAEDIDPAVWEKGPVRITSVERDRFWPKDESGGANQGRQAREAARRFVRDPANGILGSHRNQDTGWNIEVSKAKLDHAATTTTSSGPREDYHAHLEAMAAIPDLIRNAIKTGSRLDRDDNPNVAAIHTFHAPLEIGDKTYRARLAVQEVRPEGGRKLFYDHSLFRLENPENGDSHRRRPDDAPANLGVARSEHRVGATMKVADLFRNVKPPDEPQFAARRRASESTGQDARAEQGERENDFSLKSVTPDDLLAEKMRQRRQKAIRDALTKPLSGTAGDTTADMFGGGDTPLFNERRDGSSPDTLFATRRPLTDAERLDRAKKSLARRRDDLLRRVAAGDLEPVKRARVQLDAEGLKLQAEHARAKQGFDEAVEKARLAKRPFSVKAMEYTSGLARASALSGYHTLGKLFSFTVGKLAEQPLSELAGAVVEHTPGLRRIAAKADMESGSHVASLARYYSQFAGRGMAEAWRTLRTGKSNETALYGKARPETSRWYDFFGRLHDVEKTPLVTASMEAYRTKAYANAMRLGLNPTDPVVRGLINQKSYEYALADKLQESNGIADAIKEWHRKAEALDPALGRINADKMLLSTVLKTLVTKGIVKTPLNYLKQSLLERSPLGLARGISQAAAAHFRGVENLTPAEANRITRLLKLGMVGTAMTLWGMYDATKDEKDRVFGGYYQPGDKRSDADVGFGRIRIGGHQLPHWATHNLLTEPAQFGSTIVRVARSMVKKTAEQKGYTEGIYQAALAPVMSAPVISPVTQIERQSKQGGGTQVASQIVRGLIPQLVQNIAEDTDKHTPDGEAVPRGPKTVTDSVKMAIPGLRSQVGPKFYRGISDAKRQQIEDALRK